MFRGLKKLSETLRALYVSIWDVISLVYLFVKLHGALNLKFVHSTAI